MKNLLIIGADGHGKVIKEIGYDIPVLIHPTAYISRSCKIELGSVVEPMAIVNSNSILGESCIISVGSIVGHNAIVGEYCQIDAGAVVESGAKVNKNTKILQDIIQKTRRRQ